MLSVRTSPTQIIALFHQRVVQLLPAVVSSLGVVVTSGAPVSSHAVTVEQKTRLFPAYFGMWECVAGLWMGDNTISNTFSLLNDISKL